PFLPLPGTHSIRLLSSCFSVFPQGAGHPDYLNNHNRVIATSRLLAFLLLLQAGDHNQKTTCHFSHKFDQFALEVASLLARSSFLPTRQEKGVDEVAYQYLPEQE